MCSLIAFAGCKKHDTDKAADEMKKAEDKAQDVSRDVQEKVADQREKLDNARVDLTAAKTDFQTAVNTRLGKIDAKLTQLASRMDQASKDAYAALQARRADLKVKVDALAQTTDDRFNDYKKDVEDSFDAMEKDLDSATK